MPPEEPRSAQVGIAQPGPAAEHPTSDRADHEDQDQAEEQDLVQTVRNRRNDIVSPAPQEAPESATTAPTPTSTLSTPDLVFFKQSSEAGSRLSSAVSAGSRMVD